MDGSFACPECGNEVRLKGTTPGRQVRCGWCETWVEVPFLPRTPLRARRSKKRPPWVPWAWAGLGVLSIVVVMFGSGRLIRSRHRAKLERAVNELVAEAESEDKAGRADKALAAIGRALKQAGKLDPPRPERLAELRGRRDELALRSAEAQIRSAAGAEPSAAIATYKSLLSRVWRDPALTGLEATLRERLERTRREWAESDAAAARRAVADGHPVEAIKLCEQLVVTAEELPEDVFSRLQADASAIVTALVTSRGVVYAPWTGQFTLGSSQTYADRFDRLLDDAFESQGYVPRRPKSPWVGLWDARAPFRLTAEVVEREGGAYSSSNNRITIISAKLNLYRGRDPVPLWQLGPVVAQTQPSIPSMAAFTAARGGPRDLPSEKLERILYTDAWDTLRDRITARLGTIPKYRPAPG